MVPAIQWWKAGKRWPPISRTKTGSVRAAARSRHGREAAGLARLAGVGVGGVGGAGRGLVAHGADGGGEVGGRGRAFEEADGGAFLREVDGGVEDAGDGLEGLFHAGDAGGAGHLVDVERDVGHGRGVARAVDRGAERLRVGAAGDGGAVRGEVHGGAGRAGGGGKRLLHARHAGGAGHAFDLEAEGAVRHGGDSFRKRLCNVSCHGKVKGPCRSRCGNSGEAVGSRPVEPAGSSHDARSSGALRADGREDGIPRPAGRVAEDRGADGAGDPDGDGASRGDGCGSGGEPCKLAGRGGGAAGAGLCGRGGGRGGGGRGRGRLGDRDGRRRGDRGRGAAAALADGDLPAAVRGRASAW